MAVAPHTLTLRSKGQHNAVKMAFHDADTDTNILARKYRVGRKIVAVLGESVSWNSSFIECAAGVQGLQFDVTVSF